MDFSQANSHRLSVAEHTLIIAEAIYAKDPLNVENLTEWGGALIELAQSRTLSEGKTMINDAISKLDEALMVNPSKHETLWWMGNALSNTGYMTTDSNEAKVSFDKAAKFYQRAIDADPENKLYLKSLQFAASAPELHMEFQKLAARARKQNIGGPSSASSTSTAPELHMEFQMAPAMQQTISEPSSASSTSTAAKEKSSDLKYDIFGWVILAVVIVAWVGMAKSHIPPPPP